MYLVALWCPDDVLSLLLFCRLFLSSVFGHFWLSCYDQGYIIDVVFHNGIGPFLAWFMCALIALCRSRPRRWGLFVSCTLAIFCQIESVVAAGVLYEAFFLLRLWLPFLLPLCGCLVSSHQDFYWIIYRSIPIWRFVLGWLYLRCLMLVWLVLETFLFSLPVGGFCLACCLSTLVDLAGVWQPLAVWCLPFSWFLFPEFRIVFRCHMWFLISSHSCYLSCLSFRWVILVIFLWVGLLMFVSNVHCSVGYVCPLALLSVCL